MMRSCLFAAVATVVSAHELTRVLFDTSVYPQALCNDGTPSGYYFHASATGSNVWIVHQQGGGWCYNEASCHGRSGALTSSKTWSTSIHVDGLLNSTDARLYDANIVYAAYCTSDGWIGDAPSSAVGFPFTFNMLGAQVVNALFADLVKTQGLGKLKGTQVLYSGCSAGARGALFNLPRVQSLLSTLSPTPIAHFGALLDSAYWLDIQPIESSITSFAQEAQGVFAIANVQPDLNPACLSAYPGTSGWHCLIAQYTLPYLTNDTTVSFFVYAFQYDAFQLGQDWGLPFGTPPRTPAQTAYAETFRNDMRTNADAVVISEGRAGTAAMFPACFKHCNTESSTFSTIVTGGLSLEQAVLGWFFGGLSPSHTYIMEDCVGFNCGNDCPAV